MRHMLTSIIAGAVCLEVEPLLPESPQWQAIYASALNGKWRVKIRFCRAGGGYDREHYSGSIYVEVQRAPYRYEGRGPVYSKYVRGPYTKARTLAHVADAIERLRRMEPSLLPRLREMVMDAYEKPSLTHSEIDRIDRLSAETGHPVCYDQMTEEDCNYWLAMRGKLAAEED